jgi:hypothetical protein
MSGSHDAALRNSLLGLERCGMHFWDCDAGNRQRRRDRRGSGQGPGLLGPLWVPCGRLLSTELAACASQVEVTLGFPYGMRKQSHPQMLHQTSNLQKRQRAEKAKTAPRCVGSVVSVSRAPMQIVGPKMQIIYAGASGSLPNNLCRRLPMQIDGPKMQIAPSVETISYLLSAGRGRGAARDPSETF